MATIPELDQQISGLFDDLGKLVSDEDNAYVPRGWNQGKIDEIYGKIEALRGQLMDLHSKCQDLGSRLDVALTSRDLNQARYDGYTAPGLDAAGILGYTNAAAGASASLVGASNLNSSAFRATNSSLPWLQSATGPQVYGVSPSVSGWTRIGNFTAGAAIAADGFALVTATNGTDAAYAGANLATDATALFLGGGSSSYIYSMVSTGSRIAIGPWGAVVLGVGQFAINAWTTHSLQSDANDIFEANKADAYDRLQTAQGFVDDLIGQRTAVGCVEM